jgi:hypothetical protein
LELIIIAAGEEMYEVYVMDVEGKPAGLLNRDSEPWITRVIVAAMACIGMLRIAERLLDLASLP